MAQKRKIQYQPEFASSIVIPTSAGAGKILVSNSEGKAEWKSITIRVPSTYGIRGIIPATSWPLLWSSIGTTEEQKLVKVRYKLAAGTSVFCEVLHNGTPITGLTALEAVSTEGRSAEPTAVAISENDELELVTSVPSGNPETLSFTIFVEHIL